jgi:hypothetical protein
MRVFAQYRPLWRPFLMAGSFIAPLMFVAGEGHAAGTGPGGIDVLHVPISWCPVIGSPAQANPNLNGDTNTDAILWRRHERPTDNIYINTAGITFRSSINNAWTVLDFPQLTDPDTTLATVGDVRGEDVNNFGVEYNALITACDTAYTNIGRANIGVTAINVGLFHDATGAYVGTIGWGGCSQPAGQENVTCSAPYDGRIAVIDNVYLHPASPDRTFPGSNTQFILTDPFDALTGHELGHALGLDHISNTLLLMNPGMADNNGDGQVDNIAFAAGQVNVARSSSMLVQGLEIDPPLQINPGDFIADRVMDLKDDQKLEPIGDLASVKVSVDKRTNRMFISNQLRGAHKERARGLPTTHWIMLDTIEDNAAPQGALRDEKFEGEILPGTDIAIRVDVRFPKASAKAWEWRDDRFVEIPRIHAEVQSLIMHPWFAEAEGLEGPRPGDAHVYDTIVVSMPMKQASVKLGVPFGIDAVLELPELQTIDRLDGEPRDRILVIEDPDFPHCFVLEPGEPGDKVPVLVEGLLPRAPVHALVGPELVAKAVTDERGNIKLGLPIPNDVRDGLHLVTVGVDDTALTADCVVQVGARANPGDVKPPIEKRPDPRIELLRRHQDLLGRSLDMIQKLER